MPPGVSVISHCTLVTIAVWLPSSDITSGNVHLHVRRLDQSTSLPSGTALYLTGKTDLVSKHLGGHSHL